MKQPHFQTKLNWTGNKGSGTMDYRTYDRNFIVSIENKEDILGSSDAQFLGDPHKHSPEDMLVASVSSCHMLWYLHLASEQGIVVLEYSDKAVGTMAEHTDGSGKFTEIVLHPTVVISDEHLIDKANALHSEANKMCFIANSCNFPVNHQPECFVKSTRLI
jgi:organic hydroperoxide reductase OsmC/OhrA